MPPPTPNDDDDGLRQRRVPDADSGGDERVYTLAEVAEHDSADDLWLAIDGGVYDVTPYLDAHPGGHVIATWAGRDASAPFGAWHDASVRRKLARFRVGRYDAPPVDEFERDKRALLAECERRGWYDTDWSVYAYEIAVPTALFVACCALLALTSTWQAHAVAGLCLAVCWHQAAFVGHDLMHSSVFDTRFKNHVAGLLCGNALAGISAIWWKYTHDMHHCVPNNWALDPDITHMPVFAVTEKMFLHARARRLTPAQERVLKIAVPAQFLVYIPVMFVARFNLFFQSLHMLFWSKTVMSMPWQRVHISPRMLLAERLSLLAFYAYYGALMYLSYVNGGGARAMWAFFAASHGYMGILHVQITLSHWERPMNINAEKNARELDWWYQQIVTARNIEPTAWNNWYFGGLNMQIEHHIAPRVTRHNLFKMAPLARAFCAKYNIPYCQSGVFRAVSDVARSLTCVATQVQRYDAECTQREAARRKIDENVAKRNVRRAAAAERARLAKRPLSDAVVFTGEHELAL